MFIPKTTDLKQNGSPTIFSGQLNTTADQHYSSPVMVTWAGPSTGITFRTYDGFNWNISKITLMTRVIPASEQVDNWIDIKYEIAVYADERGTMKISVNGEKFFQRLNHPAIKSDGEVKLKMGIYNYGVSKMNEPRSNQVVFFDKITRTIKQD
jgi:hypothetical protein